jgi:hypothetical protein
MKIRTRYTTLLVIGMLIVLGLVPGINTQRVGALTSPIRPPQIEVLPIGFSKVEAWVQAMNNDGSLGQGGSTWVGPISCTPGTAPKSCQSVVLVMNLYPLITATLPLAFSVNLNGAAFHDNDSNRTATQCLSGGFTSPVQGSVRWSGQLTCTLAVQLHAKFAIPPSTSDGLYPFQAVYYDAIGIAEWSKGFTVRVIRYRRWLPHTIR